MIIACRRFFNRVHFVLPGVALAAAALAALSAHAEILSDDAALAKAREVVGKMTLDEKVSILGGVGTMYLKAIPRVGLYREWAMNDSSHTSKPEHGREYWPYVEGVDDRSSVLPPLSALAMTWNRELAAKHGHVQGEQFRALGKDQMLGPGLNMMRSPLCGRNWEYMGEDPYLAGELAVPLIRAVQSHGVAATVKHFAVNNQELARTKVDTVVDERTLHEYYFPAFRKAVEEGGVWSVMTSYNKMNGAWASENAYLQRDVLRDLWKFHGVIVTDWGGQHSTVAAALNGGDLEMNYGRGIKYFTDHFSGKLPLADAVRAGEVPEATVDAMATHVVWMMAKSGYFGGKEQGERLTEKHYAVCREIGGEAIALLKNDAKALPLDRAKMKKIIVVGNLADTRHAHLGCSCEAHPPYEVTPFAALGEYLGDAVKIVRYPLGAEGATGKPAAIPNECLATYRKVSSDAFVERAWERVVWREGEQCFDANPKEPDFVDYPTLAPGKANRFTAKVVPPESGVYLLSVFSESDSVAGTVYVNDRRVTNGAGKYSGTVALEKGVEVTIRYDTWNYTQKPQPVEFGWFTPGAIAAAGRNLKADAADADAILVFTGTQHGYGRAHEQEGGDLPSMKLPEGHDEAIAEILSWKRPNTVVINHSGTPMELPWVDGCETLVQHPYLGHEAGRPLVRVLFGEVNPSGKLAFTWPRRYEDTGVATMGTYNATNVIYNERFYVGYRWFDHAKIVPLFPFGYGLSYTEFEYSSIRRVDDSSIEGDSYVIKATVKNVGKVAGKETAMLFVEPIDSSVERPVKELKGFVKTRLLAPGESEDVVFALKKRDLAVWDTFYHDWRVPAGKYRLAVGASAADLKGGVVVEVKE